MLIMSNVVAVNPISFMNLNYFSIMLPWHSIRTVHCSAEHGVFTTLPEVPVLQKNSLPSNGKLQ